MTHLPVFVSHPDESNGAFVPLFAEQGNPEHYVKEFAAALGVKAKANLFPIEGVKQQSQEFYEMFAYFDEFDYYGPHVDGKLQHKFVPHPTKFKDWVKEQGEQAFVQKKDKHVDPAHTH